MSKNKDHASKFPNNITYSGKRNGKATEAKKYYACISNNSERPLTKYDPACLKEAAKKLIGTPITLGDTDKVMGKVTGIMQDKDGNIVAESDFTGIELIRLNRTNKNNHNYLSCDYSLRGIEGNACSELHKRFHSALKRNAKGDHMVNISEIKKDTKMGDICPPDLAPNYL